MFIIEEIDLLIEVVSIGSGIVGSFKSSKLGVNSGTTQTFRRSTVNFTNKIKHPTSSFMHNPVVRPTNIVSKIATQRKHGLANIKASIGQNKLRSPHP